MWGRDGGLLSEGEEWDAAVRVSPMEGRGDDRRFLGAVGIDLGFSSEG